MNIREHTPFCAPVRTKNNEIPENTLALKFPTFSFLHEHPICSTFILGLYLTIYSFSMHWLIEIQFTEHLHGTDTLWPTNWSSSSQNILNIRDWKLMQIHSLHIINYLFIKIPSIAIITQILCQGVCHLQEKNSPSLYCCLEVLTFMLILFFLTLGFITLPCGIHAPSSRVRAKLMLLSKYSRVNIILFLFLCLAIGKKNHP